jgi:rfaE bifunctional protein nucleotidyltransferase chain/domain
MKNLPDAVPDDRQALSAASPAGGQDRQALSAASPAGGQDRQAKLRTADELTALWRTARPPVVVFVNGCFDILHRGHVESLAWARSEGDVLVVGLNSDRSVRALKGPARPINGQEDRAAVLAALAAVDYVVVFDEPTPQALVETLAPDVLVKGADWRDRPIAGRAYVEAHGGRMAFAPLLPHRSTTELIRRITEMG